MLPPPPILLQRMRGIGMKMPVRTYMAAKACGLNLALACSVVMQETGGGVNEYGHDPTVFVGAGKVTRSNYRQYLVMRDTPHHGARCQGVGPVQLTYWGFQDRADALGGCWRPLVNMKVGFADLARNVRVDGLREGVKAYNGSGAAADAYADAVIERAKSYAVRLRLPSP